MKPAQPNQSLIDGLVCLQALAAHAQPIGSRELARMLDMEPTRVNRLLKTLAFVGLAHQNEQRKYLPGPAVHVLAAQSLRGSGLIRRSLEPLESLLDTGMQVAMGVRWEDEVCYLYHGRRGDRPGDALGREPLYPAEVSGLGQALLARLSEDEVKDLYANEARRRAVPVPRRRVELEGRGGLIQILALVREQGYALTETPDNAGMRTLAIALDSEDAAIGVAGRFRTGEVPELLVRLRSVADTIEDSNGHGASPGMYKSTG
ncbi:global regulatory protein [Arthrobacter tecti]